ncbi:MAG TPA: hypothetical protein VNP72_11490 [Longimicrobium sp.]|nr:hypothetical protein [Longimicrobium sp.]
MKRALFLLALATAVLTAPAAAQAVISTGMTPDQVRGAFGVPATVRVAGDWTYWFYHNGCPVRCGSDDVVFFRDDRVVSAVLRTRSRRFSGGTAHDALEAAGSDDDAATATIRPGEVQAGPTTGGDLRVGGIRVRGEAAAQPGEVIIVPSTRDAAPPASGDVIIIPSTARARQAETVTVTDTVMVRGQEPTSVDQAHRRNMEKADTSSVDRAHQRNVKQDSARAARQP